MANIKPITWCNEQAFLKKNAIITATYPTFIS